MAVGKGPLESQRIPDSGVTGVGHQSSSSPPSRFSALKGVRIKNTLSSLKFHCWLMNGYVTHWRFTKGWCILTISYLGLVNNLIIIFTAVGARDCLCSWKLQREKLSSGLHRSSNKLKIIFISQEWNLSAPIITMISVWRKLPATPELAVIWRCQACLPT